jgi:hypothetical protein
VQDLRKGGDVAIVSAAAAELAVSRLSLSELLRVLLLVLLMSLFGHTHEFDSLSLPSFDGHLH